MTTATDMRDLYIKAEKAVLNNQSYSIGSRTLTRADLSDIRDGYKYWQKQVDNETARSQGGSPLYSLADFRNC
jgi:hypothetical protein